MDFEAKRAIRTEEYGLELEDLPRVLVRHSGRWVLRPKRHVERGRRGEQLILGCLIAGTVGIWMLVGWSVVQVVDLFFG